MPPQLDGLNFDLYCDVVLPRVMEQIISCKDDIAQQYLMQAVIQVSPAAGHVVWAWAVGLVSCCKDEFRLKSGRRRVASLTVVGTDACHVGGYNYGPALDSWPALIPIWSLARPEILSIAVLCYATPQHAENPFLQQLSSFMVLLRQQGAHCGLFEGLRWVDQ